MRWLLYGCRVAAGIVFIVSAVLKFLSIDAFELYLYSLDWFPLIACIYLSRLLIAFEFALGLALIANIYHKAVNFVAYGILLFFSCFLIYLLATGYDGNCHCMGESIDLKPVPSLIKNVVLFALIFASSKTKEFSAHWLKTALPILGVVSLVSLFIASPPDGILTPKPAVVHQTGIDAFIQNDSIFKSHIANQPKAMVCLFSTGCHVCKLSARKMQIAVANNKVPTNRFLLLFHGRDHARKVFCVEAGLNGYKYEMLQPEQFGSMVGFVPVFLYFENGKLVGKYTYRTLTEEVIASLAK